jgi:hypothetical protein
VVMLKARVIEVETRRKCRPLCGSFANVQFCIAGEERKGQPTFFVFSSSESLKERCLVSQSSLAGETHKRSKLV